MKQRNRTVLNIIMVCAILLIAVSGYLFVSRIKGNFDRDDGTFATICEVRGIVSLERDGIAVKAQENTVLRDGDLIVCGSDATAALTSAESRVALGRGTSAKVICADSDNLELEIINGEAFADVTGNVTFTFADKREVISDSVVCLFVRSGAQSISVYRGNSSGASAGECVEWTGGNTTIHPCELRSLNSFNISELKRALAEKELCFTLGDLTSLEEERFKEKAARSASVIIQETDTVITSAPPASEESQVSGAETYKMSTQSPAETEEALSATDPGSGASAPDDTETEKAAVTTEVEGVKDTEETTDAPEEEIFCTLTVRCDTVLDNFDSLDPAKAPYVPEDGCIIPTVKVAIDPGDTAFDVLKRVCEELDIQIEYSWTPLYDSYYVEGINYLYEFDCGIESGWVYKVDGWMPNYGSSSFVLTGGEDVVWCYSCVGLGADVGGGRG